MFIAQSHWGLRPATTTCDLKMLSDQWSSVVLWKLPTTVRWSLPILGGLWVLRGPLCDQLVIERYLVHAVGRREVLCSLLSVGECCMMVFSSRRKVSMVFSSRRPLIVGDWLAMPTNCRPPRVPPNYAFCLRSVGQRMVSNRSLTCKRPLSTMQRLVETSRRSRHAAV